ncbi:MAG: hypothetical protein KAJ33_07825, partial [Thermoplasmata archaeon]|nr:hypothetical protein [Thermoplasmata archaeon]
MNDDHADNRKQIISMFEKIFSTYLKETKSLTPVSMQVKKIALLSKDNELYNNISINDDGETSIDLKDVELEDIVSILCKGFDALLEANFILEPEKAMEQAEELIRPILEEYGDLPTETGIMEKILRGRYGSKKELDKDSILSDFMKIPGLGPSKARSLLKWGYTSLEELKQASSSDLSKVPGISLKYGREMKEFLQNIEIAEEIKSKLGSVCTICGEIVGDEVTECPKCGEEIKKHLEQPISSEIDFSDIDEQLSAEMKDLESDLLEELTKEYPKPEDQEEPVEDWDLGLVGAGKSFDTEEEVEDDILELGTPLDMGLADEEVILALDEIIEEDIAELETPTEIYLEDEDIILALDDMIEEDIAEPKTSSDDMDDEMILLDLDEIIDEARGVLTSTDAELIDKDSEEPDTPIPTYVDTKKIEDE